MHTASSKHILHLSVFWSIFHWYFNFVSCTQESVSWNTSVKSKNQILLCSGSSQKKRHRTTTLLSTLWLLRRYMKTNIFVHRCRNEAKTQWQWRPVPRCSEKWRLSKCFQMLHKHKYNLVQWMNYEQMVSLVWCYVHWCMCTGAANLAPRALLTFIRSFHFLN